jgi:2-amino-4-hydroxy-6-hydroxymethyldihydropteridine diphosphokinase
MSLFIAIGTNLGDRYKNLEVARNVLSSTFHLIDESRIYESPAVDYLNQPDFLNQVLEFKTPTLSPDDVLDFCLAVEKLLGRERDIPKGPRTIDIDLLFWDHSPFTSQQLTLPHPRLFQRSFVVLPLSELKGFLKLQKHYKFTFDFDNTATPIS